MNLKIAHKAFSRRNDYLNLNLLYEYQKNPSVSKSSDLSFLGDFAAHRNRFSEAAELYRQAGHEDKAISMYSDLRMFDAAQELMRAADPIIKQQLDKKKADWVSSTNDPRSAAEMYLSGGDVKKAIEITGQHGWVDM